MDRDANGIRNRSLATVTSVGVSTPVVVGAIAVSSLALLWLWVAATRKHVQRRRRGDWEGANGRPELWTSSARCPTCQHLGGVLEARGEELWFVCMSCQGRHKREAKG
jgi:hypothetical protein